MSKAIHTAPQCPLHFHFWHRALGVQLESCGTETDAVRKAVAAGLLLNAAQLAGTAGHRAASACQYHLLRPASVGAHHCYLSASSTLPLRDCNGRFWSKYITLMAPGQSSHQPVSFQSCYAGAQCLLPFCALCVTTLRLLQALRGHGVSRRATGEAAGACIVCAPPHCCAMAAVQHGGPGVRRLAGNEGSLHLRSCMAAPACTRCVLASPDQSDTLTAASEVPHERHAFYSVICKQLDAGHTCHVFFLK